MKIEDLMNEYQGLPEYSGIVLSGVNQPSLFGDFPMNVAATRGSIDEMGVLISSGADINCVGEHGYTPLLNAIEQCKLEAVVWLVGRGADMDVRTCDGMTAFDVAEAVNCLDIIDFLEKSKQA